MSELKTKLKDLVKDLEARQGDIEDAQSYGYELRNIASELENLSSVDDIIEDLRELEQGISDEPELKPCPFCGNVKDVKFIIPEDVDSYSSAPSDYAVCCDTSTGHTGCGATSGFGSETKEQAALKWNRRV